MNNHTLSRRNFVKTAGVASAATFAILPAIHGQQAPSRKLRVGVMGLKRGSAHITGFQAVPNVEIAYVCDVDKHRAAEGAALANKGQKNSTKMVGDFRHILEDNAVDILSIAAPNFWHAPATILACAAGKHVYVEKPGSYSAEEGELMVKAARKYNRKVQQGTQRRSYESMIDGMEKLHGGAIGKVRYARTWYANTRESIGHGKPATVPDYLDYDLWQGPVPVSPYKDNLVHYNWHWHWNYGGGELANNGVHALDIARWGLQVDYPTKVTYLGSRYNFDDDQETPDTGVAQFDCGEVGATWEGSSCQRRSEENLAFCTFYGETGSMAFDTAGFKIYDSKGKMIDDRAGTPGDVPHFQNFCDAIRDDVPLNQDIEEGQKSTHWCHLGNMAYRTNSVVEVHPKTGRIKNNPEAQKFWKRSYRKGWQPKV
ncbi:MAG: Gfo/Idh/MocA family oxidoreductase [Verrucomicrobia bacterium]|nr:Gfo/Idh/MocA family oxidoreductase [Verrucomicrobiota bacterium]MDA1067146.1 Gfo/Idh/MocA family oxidoreductase [Verrucomicrobiota bacterium]